LEGFEKLPPARGDRDREDDGRARAAVAPGLGAARSDPRLRPGNLSEPVAIWLFCFSVLSILWVRFVIVSPGFGGVVCSCCTSRSTRTLRGDGSSPRRMITKVCARIVMVSLDLFRSEGLVGLWELLRPRS
jgi:hypothetical protein